MRRVFTRADIETYVQENWGADLENSLTIKQVYLLKGFSKPVWRVQYCIDRGVPIPSYRGTLILTQRQWPQGNITLWSVESTELPQGCATVEEEQKAMRKAQRERRKE